MIEFSEPLDNRGSSEAGVAEVELGLVGGIVVWKGRIRHKAAGRPILAHSGPHIFEVGDELRVPSSKRVIERGTASNVSPIEVCTLANLGIAAPKSMPLTRMNQIHDTDTGTLERHARARKDRNHGWEERAQADIGDIAAS